MRQAKLATTSKNSKESGHNPGIYLMPHSRERYLTPILLADLKWSPAVGIFGLRQAGKTTLVEKITADLKGQYETFDREASLRSATEAPIEFCSRESTLTIDEAQRCPQIFPAIKELIGTRRKPGCFLLTGSIRFTLKKEIRESLTGRITLHELLPFNLSETLHKPPARFLESLLAIAAASGSESRTIRGKLEKFERRGDEFSAKEIERYTEVGGMPIPCFTREKSQRTHWFRDYFETLLARDVTLIDEKLAGIPMRQKQSFLRVLGLHQGTAISWIELARKTSLRPEMAKRLFHALELLSLIDLVPPEITGAKPSKANRIEWKDIGLWRHALGLTPGQAGNGADLSTRVLLSQEFRTQISLMSQPAQWFSYRSRDGAEIPWIFRSGDSVLAMDHIPVESPSPLETRAIRAFIEREKQGIGIILGSRMTSAAALAPRVWLIPYTWAF